MVCRWGNTGQKLKQKPLKNASHWFVLHALLSLLFHTPRATCMTCRSYVCSLGFTYPQQGRTESYRMSTIIFNSYQY